MITRVKKWGNSLAIRLTGMDLRQHDLREGDLVNVSIKGVVPEEDVDLSELPSFPESDSKVSENHDRYLYGGE